MNLFPFEDIITDNTSKFKKIMKKDYLPSGEFRIIDQGQKFIVGYTNDESLINELPEPIIVFGDHTRIFKYVDFPIALGADGAKALTVNTQIAWPKYIYYYLRGLKLHNAGYSRHFKFLKAVNIPIPEKYEDQIRIATILSKIECMIEKRKESLGLLDEFLKSVFVNMFGDFQAMNKMDKENLEKYIIFLTSGSRGWAKYYSKSGEIFIRIANVGQGNLKLNDLVYVKPPQTAESVRSKVKKGDLLMSITADLGRTAVVDERVEGAHINQHLALVRLSNEINPIFAAWFYSMPYGKSQIMKKNREGVKAALNFDDIRTLPMINVPIKLQNKFEALVEMIDSIKNTYSDSLFELTTLFDSISQKAFIGELDVSCVSIDNTSTNFNVDDEDNFILESSDFSHNSLKKLVTTIIHNSTRSLSFDEIQKEIDKLELKEVYDYEQVKSYIFEMLNAKMPNIEQIFEPEHDGKNIRFRGKR